MDLPLKLLLCYVTAFSVHAFPFFNVQREPPTDSVDPFTGICADRMGEVFDNITSYTTKGIVGDCYRYALQCMTDVGNQTFVEDCGVGLWWDDEFETCVLPDEAAANRPACVKEHCGSNAAGAEEFVIVDKRACYAFFECETGVNAIVYEMCPSGLYFVASAEDCDMPSGDQPPCRRPEPLSAQACRNSTMPAYCPPGQQWNAFYCQCTHPFMNLGNFAVYDYEF